MIRSIVAALAAIAAVAACGAEPEPTGAAGMAAGVAVAATVEAAETVRAPWRCALGPAPGAPPVQATLTIGARTWRREGERLVVARGRPRVTIAAVADARGAAPAVADVLRAAHVDVVVAVGGMGAGADALHASLAALTDPAWLTVAVPGGSEDWPALARTVGDLAAAGAPAVDGGGVRVVDAGAAVIAVIPGERHPERLAAGAEGCVHDDADRARILRLLADAAGERPRVLVGIAAPQGEASDLAPGGIHAGEPGLAEAVADAEVDVVVHAPLDAEPPAPGRARTGDRVVLAAGSLDPVPRLGPGGGRRPTGVTLVTVDGRTVTWRFVPVAVE